MDIIYIKYKKDKRISIIKNGNTILNVSSTIQPLREHKKIESKNNLSTCNSASHKKINNSAISPAIDLQKYISSHDSNKNDEITNFFFKAVHENYLCNRK